MVDNKCFCCLFVGFAGGIRDSDTSFDLVLMAVEFADFLSVTKAPCREKPNLICLQPL